MIAARNCALISEPKIPQNCFKKSAEIFEVGVPGVLPVVPVLHAPLLLLPRYDVLATRLPGKLCTACGGSGARSSRVDPVVLGTDPDMKFFELRVRIRLFWGCQIRIRVIIIP